ncbi:DNA gyrase subunit A [Pleomorphomonas sp. NRK KF1]|uniref:DNA gyrase subunit A n=1 Tax=Pleomorphomonas sp. NRK KF1 TaxID=2943000 RepID=UPI002043B800|nr:DNA gyrase subunit A [Pleomorphomonas sp. NRK KF1]MCM5552286.1 DNA gyrase subunit A [Pleomorphomonas sp. NRK KF1]
MKRSYLDYAMSVIVSRALPDVRDGLKPVHRRILYSMSENGYDWNKPYRKSARVVGDVIGKYHPHGDSSIYDALVRMAQPFSMRLPLVDGQGNFGSIDGDSAAAMRYTEVRLERVAQALTDDLDKDTVDFNPNYDGSEREPSVLPARFPNLLVNGSGGIAVGMATNIPSHNLGEVVDATIRLMDNPDADIEELMEVLPGPDFPTGAMILGRSGIRQAFMTGRGSVVMRSRVTIEQVRKDREALIVTEVPYQVNKSVMVEKIAELVREKRVEGIADLRDESSRDGIRVVIELKRDAVADVVLNQLYRFSQLQTSFGVNMVALNGGRPQLMNIKDVLSAFIAFRETVVTRRTRFLLGKARDRAHVLVGLAIAVANIDEVIAVIRNAPDPGTAREQLMTRRWPAADVEALIRLIDDPRHEVNDDGTYNLSEEQARAILDLRLQRLTALGRDEISDELNQLAEEIKGYLEILASRDRVLEIIRNELVEIKTAYATPRRTEIVESDADMEDEDLIAREEMVVTVSHEGYIKRVQLSQYRAQNRGGKGRSGMATKEEDFVTRLFIASTHAPVLFFSSRGIAYKLKVWRLPLGTPQSRGKFIKNILPLQDGERITSILALPEDERSWADLDVVFATRLGTVRRNKLSDFTQVNRNGKIAMKFDDELDGIVGVETCTEDDDFLLVSALGQCIRFPVGDVRVFKGRDSTGVRGISLADGDELISMTILRHFDASPAERTAFQKQWTAEQRVAGDEETDVEDVVADETEEEGNGIDALSPERYAEMMLAQQFVLTVNEHGYGKRSSSYEFRISGRGGKGIKATDQSKLDEIGKLVAGFPVEPTDQIMLVSDGGQLIRVPVGQVRIVSRASKGVRIFNTAEGEKVVSVEHISDIGEESSEENGVEE